MIAFHAFAVLAAHGAREHVLRRHDRHRLEDLGLLIANHVGIERNRRLHRHQRNQLEDVIGNHVAHGAGGFVIAAARFHADRLRHGDLDMIDVAAIPDGLEDSIRETEHQNVLDGFLAQVMIDAVDLFFAENGADLCV